MTVVAHVYTATVGGVTVDVKGGSLTLDAGRAPYVLSLIHI